MQGLNVMLHIQKAAILRSVHNLVQGILLLCWLIVGDGSEGDVASSEQMALVQRGCTNQLLVTPLENLTQPMPLLSNIGARVCLAWRQGMDLLQEKMQMNADVVGPSSSMQGK